MGKKNNTESKKKNINKKLLSVSVWICAFLVFATITSSCGVISEQSEKNNTSYTEYIETTINETSNSTVENTTTEKETTKPKPATVPVVVKSEEKIDLSDIPKYSGDPYVEINGNVPTFDDSELATKSYEHYSDLDSLGRCRTAVACIGKDIMPTEERGSIGMVKPTGWHTVKYDCVSGKYLYNRCHLIAYELAAENANERNLITGTRYMNIEGMLPFENMVTDYVKETGNHVMYRVTPVFKGNNLLASGVHMEAESVEDYGDGIYFNIYCYNVQPKITIDYATGDSSGPETVEEITQQVTKSKPVQEEEYHYSNDNSVTYIVNISTGKFHYASCRCVKQMKESNKMESNDRDSIISSGYEPCKVCNP